MKYSNYFQNNSNFISEKNLKKLKRKCLYYFSCNKKEYYFNKQFSQINIKISAYYWFRIIFWLDSWIFID